MSENSSSQEKKKLLIIDGNNNYFRAFIVDPSLSNNGEPIGGIKGFLKILQKLIREVNPNRVIICWDGTGGSRKKKLSYKEYKDGRKPLRLNRNIRNLDENEELKNKVWQMLRLVEYLNQMPIIQLMFDGVEADDIISALVYKQELKDYQKVIVSSDKDFIQLCNKNTILYRPVQKEILNTKRILEEYKIHPNNFCLARALSGDTSDNIDGVDGVGLPTVAKRFPFLSEEKTYYIDDIISFSRENKGKAKAFDNIVDQEKKIKLNYSLMQLYSSNLSIQDVHKINYALENSECTFNKIEIQKMMLTDGFGESNFEELYMNLKRIMNENC
jgi:DNA polymerase-1